MDKLLKMLTDHDGTKRRAAENGILLEQIQKNKRQYHYILDQVA